MQHSCNVQHHFGVLISVFLSVRQSISCCFFAEELQKRNEVIRVLTQRVLVVETREEEGKGELGAARRQLSELEHKQQCISRKCEGFEVTTRKCCKCLCMCCIL